MELRHIRYFLAVAEELHFRRASETLHLTQPALSVQIHQLEEEIGTKLLIRSTRNVQLTPAGEALYKCGKTLLSELNDIIRFVREVGNGTEGSLSLVYVGTAAAGLLPRALGLMQKIMPQVGIELSDCSPQQQIQRILNGKADLGFMHYAVDNPALETMAVQNDELIVAIPETIKISTPVDLKQMASYTLFVPRPAADSSTGIYGSVMEAYKLAGASPARILHTNVSNGLEFVAAGAGISLIPCSYQSHTVEGVQYHPLKYQPESLNLLAVWRKDSKSKILDQFLRVLHELTTLEEKAIA